MLLVGSIRSGSRTPVPEERNGGQPGGIVLPFWFCRLRRLASSLEGRRGSPRRPFTGFPHREEILQKKNVKDCSVPFLRVPSFFEEGLYCVLVGIEPGNLSRIIGSVGSLRI
jgi:hypothetical protein